MMQKMSLERMAVPCVHLTMGLYLLGVDFVDQADGEGMVIRGLLRGHEDTPCGRPTPGRPRGHLGVGRPQGVFGVFSYY
jgi:hypothetical protein